MLVPGRFRIGVFQVESRAQMNMLPRLKPRKFYDLVIEVAIVRPGPIQGDMVHPYLRRRDGLETGGPIRRRRRSTAPLDELRRILDKTLGVPLFQEQAMKIAIVGAGFTPEEADQLRRAMATFRKTGTIHHFHKKMTDGMIANGYDLDFAERCFRQIEGFGEYGFPESHAASFALLAYVSAWMKYYYPAAFACALLNSQPMGFYAPAQIVGDARNHGVEVRPVDVNASFWDYTLEPALDGGQALRIGFRQIKGLREDEGERLVAKRGNGYPDPATLWRRAGLQPRSLALLARADAFGSMGLNRRQALWAVRGLGQARGGAAAAVRPCRRAGAWRRSADPAAGDGPGRGGGRGLHRAADEPARSPAEAAARRDGGARGHAQCRSAGHRRRQASDGRRAGAGAAAAGHGQRRHLHHHRDETGWSNIVVWPDQFARYRKTVMRSRLLMVRGRLQREASVIHIIAARLEDLSPTLDQLSGLDGPVPVPLDHADAVKHPHSGRRPKPGADREDALSPLPRISSNAGARPSHPRDQTRYLFSVARFPLSRARSRRPAGRIACSRIQRPFDRHRMRRSLGGTTDRRGRRNAPHPQPVAGRTAGSPGHAFGAGTSAPARKKVARGTFPTTCPAPHRVYP